MKRIAAVCLLASFAVATVYGKTVVGSSSASNSSVSIKEMSMSDIEKAFGGSGFGGSFSGNGVGFGNVVKSYTGKPSVVLKECCVYPPIGTNVPSSATFDRFKYGRKGYFAATYIVLAQNIVDIDLENLVVESITDGSGKDYTKKKNGDANWEAEPFRSSVNREAGFATFMLCGGGNAWAKSLPKVKGKVTVTVADKMATKELSGKISSGKIGEGEYSYKVKLASNLMSDEKSLEVSPVGSKADCELEVYCGDKKLGSTGSFSMNGKKSYNFKKPDGDDIVIKIQFPEGAKKIVIPFG